MVEKIISFKQIILDLFDCSTKIIVNRVLLEDLLKKIVNISDLNIVKTVDYDYGNGAFTIVFILKESHIILHTWPEIGFVSIDLFSCKTNLESEKIIDISVSFLKAESYKLTKIDR